MRVTAAVYILMVMIFNGCRDYDAEQQAARRTFELVTDRPSGGDYDMTGVDDSLTFDDGNGMLYIRAAKPAPSRCDNVLVELMQKKNSWMAKHPNAKIISASVVADANAGNKNHAMIYGMLLVYEVR